MSPQHLLDCDGFDNGCGGGDIKSAMDFLTRDGIHTLECNPYTSFDGEIKSKCMWDDECVSGEPLKYKCESDSVVVMETPEAIK